MSLFFSKTILSRYHRKEKEIAEGNITFFRVYDQYIYMMENLRDTRADDLPLMSSIWPTVFICLSYVYIIKIAGPAFMKDRKPYELKYFVIVYNLFQTIFSLWGFKQGWR